MSEPVKTSHIETKPLILWEDAHFLALWKPLGFVCEEDHKGRGVPQWLRSHRPDLVTAEGLPGLLHRLDAPVTGVLLLGKTPQAIEKGMALFKGREISKIYWAWVEGRQPYPKGRLKHYLSRPEQATGKVKCSNEPFTDSREALLDFEILFQAERYTCLTIRLLTGRTHQIRAQLAKTGFPVKGDLKYGAKRSNPGGGIALHSRALEFTHPITGEKIRVRAKPPQDALWDLLPPRFSTRKLYRWSDEQVAQSRNPAQRASKATKR